MKRIVLLAFVLFGSAVVMGQNLKQCTTIANDLIATVKTDSDFSSLSKHLTAGDELVLSTKLSHCLEQYQAQLTPAQFGKLDRISYKLDADVISRMFDFMQRHNLADEFNDEEEARKAKK
jgi:hypothetical protein